MPLRFLILPAALLALATISESLPAQPKKTDKPLSAATFKDWRQTICTDYEFRWRCLPWEINPGEAAVKAAREGKPILTFGGHDGVPLGFE